MANLVQLKNLAKGFVSGWAEAYLSRIIGRKSKYIALSTLRLMCLPPTHIKSEKNSTRISFRFQGRRRIGTGVLGTAAGAMSDPGAMWLLVPWIRIGNCCRRSTNMPRLRYMRARWRLGRKGRKSPLLYVWRIARADHPRTTAKGEELDLNRRNRGFRIGTGKRSNLAHAIDIPGPGR
jgi:hypothetical protein